MCLLALPLPSWAGQWVVSYSSTGTYSYDSVGPNGTTPYFSTPINGTGSGWSGTPDPGGVDAQITDSVTATLTWQPGYAQTMATDPPPTTPVYIKETAVAEETPGSWNGSGSAPTPAGTASNGLGDTPQAWNNGYLCTGAHLLQKDGSSGVITLDAVSMSAACPQTHVVNGNPDWMWTDDVSVNLTVSVDSRNVTISSDIDTTHRRVAGSPATSAANVPGPDGTVNADTLAPDNGGVANIITYTANYVGNWAVSSSYKWFSSMLQDGEGGSFNSGDTLDTQYSYFNPPASPGQKEHVYIHLTDGADGANATANYYLKFHNKYEDWTEDTSKRVTHPASYVKGGTNADFNYIGEYDNDTSVDQKPSQSLKWETQKTESGTIGSSVVSQATDPAGYIQFSANESITSTTQKTITYTLDPAVTVPKNTGIRVYVGPVSTDLFGMCSVWDQHGYVGSGDTSWYGTQVPGSYSVAYEQYPRP